MKRGLSKNDLILVGVLLAVDLLGLLAVRVFYQSPGDKVVLEVDNQVIGTYALDQDQEIPIEIGGEIGNRLVIAGGKADMVDATCPDRLCVHQKAISKQGETIVCLPHKVVVEIRSEQGSKLDALAR